MFYGHSNIHEKNDFAKVSINLDRYRSKNDFVGVYLNNYVYLNKNVLKLIARLSKLFAALLIMLSCIITLIIEY